VALRQAIATGLLLLSAQVRQLVEAFTVSLASWLVGFGGPCSRLSRWALLLGWYGRLAASVTASAQSVSDLLIKAG
jgi:hypothetical protein